MPTMNLESLKSIIESKYEPLTIDEPSLGGKFDLIMPLRLSDEKLKHLSKAQHEFNAIQERQPEAKKDDEGNEIPMTPEEEDEVFNLRPQMIAKMREILTIPATDETLCQRWLDMIGDDLVALSELLAIYQDSTQLGEASASQDS